MNWLLLILDWIQAFPEFKPDSDDPTRDIELTRIKRR